MEELTGYLQRMFGPQVHLQDYIRVDDLPMYLTAGYQFYTLELDSEEYVLVKPRDTGTWRIDPLKKQLAQIRKFTKRQLVLVLENLRLSQRNSLIQKRIPFIVPEKQLYIPHCLMALTEAECSYETYGDTFAVATQVVFIYLLLNKIRSTNAHQLCAHLPYSVASVNRALKELCYRKLLQTVGSNTRKQYMISDGRKFWERGKQYLFDPVKNRRYVLPDVECGDYPMSGALALGKLSFLEGGDVPSYASTAQDFKKIDKKKILNEYDLFDQRYNVIEIFRYDPKILGGADHIDVVSLYAQFKDNKDERIQIEIESLVHEILW